MTDKPHGITNRNPGQRTQETPPLRRHIRDVSRIRRGICADCNERLPFLFQRGTDYICPACDKARRKADRARAYGA